MAGACNAHYFAAPNPIRYMKTTLRFLQSMIAITLFLSSCKKTASPAPDAQPIRAPRFEVLLQPYMIEVLDSAFVQSESNGVSKRIQLNRSGDTLFCSIDSIARGEGSWSCTLYPHKLEAGRRWLWTTEKQLLQNDGHSLLSYKGPTCFTDSAWLPRLYIPDPVLNLTFIAGLRPSDPYFLLENVNPKWVDIEVYKEFYKTKGGISQVGTASFTCLNNCPLVNKKMENLNSFAGMPARIGDRKWDHIEISASFGDGNYRNGWSLLTFNYTLPD